jgi:FAD:protein FMN transferase
VAASTRQSQRSKPTLPPSGHPHIRDHSIRFEAIGTGWQIDTARPITPSERRVIDARIDAFDRTWSRFRDDSLVARIAREPGHWAFPADAAELFATYRRLYDATGGAVSPLVGDALNTLGYDSAYSLRQSGTARAVPDWDNAVSWDGSHLSTVRPMTLDVGAAGKGYLVDIVGELLHETGHTEIVVDASGDIRHWGSGSIRVALEHPLDPTKAIGVVSVGNASICSSATNRRQWGNGLHHVIDVTTGLPTQNVIATWAIAPSGLDADGLATALFFTDPVALASEFHFTFVRMFANGTTEFSPDLDGELFK